MVFCEVGKNWGMWFLFIRLVISDVMKMVFFVWLSLVMFRWIMGLENGVVMVLNVVFMLCDILFVKVLIINVVFCVLLLR